MSPLYEKGFLEKLLINPKKESFFILSNLMALNPTDQNIC